MFINCKVVSGELTMIDEFEQAMNEAIRRLGKSTGSSSRKIDQLLAVLATALKKNNSELNEVKSNRKTKKSARLLLSQNFRQFSAIDALRDNNNNKIVAVYCRSEQI